MSPLKNPTRTEALSSVLDDIAAFEINVPDYWGDSEPQGYYDTFLTGLVNSLLAFCQTLGWAELISHLQNMTPIRGNAVESLETLHRFVIPEARRLLAASDIERAQSPNQWFWEFVHPRICALARPRFDAGFFGDAVESSFKDLNDAVKRIVRDTDGRELDGATLMNTAFSPNNPIVKLTPLSTVTEIAEQQGFMQIMAGSMTGIRNPKAHGNSNPDRTKTLHLICLASLLMHKLDERS